MCFILGVQVLVLGDYQISACSISPKFLYLFSSVLDCLWAAPRAEIGFKI